MTTVFVYGTLKRRGSNHRLLQRQTFLGPARTAPGYQLVSLGEYPGMIRQVADRDGVAGELWEVSDPCLTELDELEGIAEGLYERAVIELQLPRTHPHAQAYLYLRDVTGRPMVGSEWPV